MQQVNLAENIWFLGFNDRRTHLFENIWPIPHGISYNSYLIVDDKIALIDTVERSFIDEYLDNIEDIIGDRPIDYLVINHMEPDHSGALKAIVQKYPSITLVGNKKTFGFVESYYMKPEKVLEVYDGHVLELGKHGCSFNSSRWSTGPKPWLRSRKPIKYCLPAMRLAVTEPSTAVFSTMKSTSIFMK
jgi:flavorubredoxin